MSNFLVVCPESDQVERIMSAAWARAFIGEPTAGASSVQALPGRAATRAAITATLRNDIGLLYFGHGLADQLGNSSPLVDSSNVGSAAGALIVAFACYSAQRLGPEAIRQNVAAYLGFDDLLAVYGPPANAVAVGIMASLERLAEGGTVEDAYDTLGRALDDVVDEYAYGSRRRHPDAPLILVTARLMRRSLVLCGDRSYSLP